jgi:cytochrome c oxidase subunit I
MATVTTPTPWFLRRPKATHGFWSWITTVDHKKIGILYGYTAFAFFILGGLEALVIRAQLATPEGQVVSADLYNQLFTTHGVTMIFLVVMPMGAAFFNYFIPLMIGARDVAFPRLNALSYWVFLFGGLFLYSSFLFGGAPDGGWFAYAPLTTGGQLPSVVCHAGHRGGAVLHDFRPHLRRIVLHAGRRR